MSSAPIRNRISSNTPNRTRSVLRPLYLRETKLAFNYALKANNRKNKFLISLNSILKQIHELALYGTSA